MEAPRYYSLNGHRIIGQGKLKDGRIYYMCQMWGKVYCTLDLGETWQPRYAKKAAK